MTPSRIRNASPAAADRIAFVPAASAGLVGPRRRSASRAIYLALLGLAALLVLRLAFGAAAFAEAPGVVDRGEAAVGVEWAGRTERVLVEAGQSVRSGTPLMEVSVLSERTAAEGARREADRIRIEVGAEVERANTKARERVAATLSEAARLRDDALRARGDAGQAHLEIAGLRRQLAELDEEIAAREELQRQQILARSALVDLRMRRHDLHGRQEGLRVRKRFLEENATQLEAAAERLEHEAANAGDEALRASNLASLEARAAQLDHEARRHDELSRQAVLAPMDGQVAWVDARSGEVVQAGQAIVTLVPEGGASVIAWPGASIGSFPLGARVQVIGEGFATAGTVERILVADRAKPRTLLRPYEHEAVEAAILVRLDEAGAEAARAASVVSVRRPRLGWMERWLIPAPAKSPERIAKRASP